MSLRKQLLTTALFFSATAATAAITPDQLITAYRNQGYTSVEVKLGPTQIKVEAVSGRQKIEVIYDRETGTILSKERSLATGDDLTGGVEIGKSDDDFIDGADDEADDEADDDTDDDTDDEADDDTDDEADDDTDEEADDDASDDTDDEADDEASDEASDDDSDEAGDDDDNDGDRRGRGRGHGSDEDGSND